MGAKSKKKNPHHRLPLYSVSATATAAAARGEAGENAAATASGTTARERRLLKVREERRRREYERERTYPGWIALLMVLDNACRDDEGLRAILGDSIGNPELMKQRARISKKGRAEFNKSKTGSMLVLKSSFRDFNPLNSFIWFELFGEPTDRDIDLLGGVNCNSGLVCHGKARELSTLRICSWPIQCWTMTLCTILIKLLLQCLHLSMISVMSSSKTIGLEFGWTLEPGGKIPAGYRPGSGRENPGRFFRVLQIQIPIFEIRLVFKRNSTGFFPGNPATGRFFPGHLAGFGPVPTFESLLGTSDYLGLDVLRNCLTQLGSEPLGIKQVVFGGKKMGDWEEGV